MKPRSPAAFGTFRRDDRCPESQIPARGRGPWRSDSGGDGSRRAGLPGCERVRCLSHTATRITVPAPTTSARSGPATSVTTGQVHASAGGREPQARGSQELALQRHRRRRSGHALSGTVKTEFTLQGAVFGDGKPTDPPAQARSPEGRAPVPGRSRGESARPPGRRPYAGRLGHLALAGDGSEMSSSSGRLAVHRGADEDGVPAPPAVARTWSPRRRSERGPHQLDRGGRADRRCGSGRPRARAEPGPRPPRPRSPRR